MTTQPGGAHTNPDHLRARLNRLLEEQEALYAALDTMSREQGEHIHSEDTDALLGVLGRRQVVVDRLASVGAEFAPFKDKWPEMMARLDAASRTRFNERIDALASTVSAIAERDERDRAALEDRRGRIAGELDGVRRSRGAVAAYATNARVAPGPRYQDREG
jgi:hypothetical protein